MQPNLPKNPTEMYSGAPASVEVAQVSVEVLQELAKQQADAARPNTIPVDSANLNPEYRPGAFGAIAQQAVASSEVPSRTSAEPAEHGGLQPGDFKRIGTNLALARRDLLGA